MIEAIDPFLRGWGNYIRTGNAAHLFRQADRYVRGGSAFNDQEAGGNLRRTTLSSAQKGGFGHGLHQLRGTNRKPKAAITFQKLSVSPMREIRTYGLKGGWGNGPTRHRAPDD